MNCTELELDVDAEHIMWMYHLKYFIELRRKYDTFIKFRGHRAFLEGPDIARVRIALENVRRRANQEFVYDFLMESDNPDESYAPYMDLLSNQEYELIKKQYQGLYIFTKKQFMNIKSELSSRYGYVANFSKPYPLNYVIVWLPQNKQSFLSQRITTLVQVICKSIEQGVTPMNAQYFSYRNRDLAARNVFHKRVQIKVSDFQAIQIFMIFDIRKIEEHYQVCLSLQDGGNTVQLMVQGQSDYNCHSAMETLENHLRNKILLQMPLESKEHLEQEMKRVIQSSDIEAHANRLDQLFGTDILRRITSNLNKSLFVFIEMSEVNYLRSKIRGENQSSYFTNSNLPSDLVKTEIIQSSNQILEQSICKQEQSICKQEQRFLRVIKDHKLLTIKDAVIIEFFNYTEGTKFYLFQNNFNDEEFQKDFDDYSRDNYTFPHLISPDYSVPNQLKFKIEIFDTDQKKVIVQIKDFLEHYMNFKIVLGVKNYSNIDLHELEELSDDYNCKLIIKRCDLSNRQVGWIEDDEPPENSKGKDCIIILNNLIHCFVRQVKQKIEKIIQLQQQKIITLLFESQFEYAYNLASLKKLNIFSHFYLEDCYWVQIECKDPKSILQNIRENDLKVLNQVLEKMHVKQTESIILTQSSDNYDCYDVFIKERSEEYYSNLRSDYLKYCLTEEEWKCVQLQPDESLFYVNVTDLNIDPFLLEPTIYEISSFQKPGILYERITDLDKGIYLIGRARQVKNQQFNLQECSHLISSIVSIK